MLYYPLEYIINWLAPPVCINCYVEAEALCAGCRESIADYQSTRCVLCNKFTNSKDICAKCTQSTGIDEAYIGGSYEGLLRTAILSYKFDSNRLMAESLARLMSDRLPYFSDESTIITFVPTTPAHVRVRGFDHAKRLAKVLAMNRQLEIAQLVQRVNYFEQRGETRQRRLSQAKGSFAPTKHNLSGKTIIVFDDVITTGATISAIAKQLRKMHAEKIVVAALAHGKY